MSKPKLHITLWLLFVTTPFVFGQWDIPYTQFWQTKNLYNPAFVGQKKHVELSGAYKLLWTGIDNSPKQLYVSAVTPIEFLGMQHTVGIIMSNVSMGSEHNSQFSGQYNYVWDTGRSRFAVGIEAGMLNINFDESSYTLKPDTTQDNKMQLTVNPVDKKTFNINAGISWHTDRFFAGVAARHINQARYYATDITGTTDSENATPSDSAYSKIPISYNFMTGYNIRLFHTLFEVQPMFFFQTDGTHSYRHIAMQTAYNRRFFLGAMWKGNSNYAFFAGVRFLNLELNYAYDLHQTGIGKESNGSHEISFRYNFPVELRYKKPQPHKSIRLL